MTTQAKPSFSPGAKSWTFKQNILGDRKPISRTSPQKKKKHGRRKGRRK